MDTILDHSISTKHRGKGEFRFVPIPFVSYFLEIDLGGGKIAKIDIPMQQVIPIPFLPASNIPIISDVFGTIF